MKTVFSKISSQFAVFTFMIFFSLNLKAQTENNSKLTDINKNDVVMNWNKSTPEQEMKDDCKALLEKGITIKYSNVKRNSKQEITAIKVEYTDRKGNKGAMELNNQSPIAPLTFFKEGEQIGFGNPTNSDRSSGNDMLSSLFGKNGSDIMKQFQFNFNGENFDEQNLNGIPNEKRLGKSKIIIKKEGKKPLVIENGEVTEGGEDYTKEEIEEIKKNNKVDPFQFNDGDSKQNEFDLTKKDGSQKFKLEMEKLQNNFQKSNASKSDLETTKQEMLQAKEEMKKATLEMEMAKKELEKAKQSLKK